MLVVSHLFFACCRYGQVIVGCVLLIVTRFWLFLACCRSFQVVPRFSKYQIRHFPCIYKNILLNWKQYLLTDPETISGILSENQWLSKHMGKYNSHILNKISQKNINFVNQLLIKSCQFKKWQTLKDKYHLENDNIFNRFSYYMEYPRLGKTKLNKT